MSKGNVKGSHASLFDCPLSNKAPKKINNSKKINTTESDEPDICKHCNERLRITRELKELCKELNLLDKTEDDSLPDIHKNYSAWAEKFLPLITYPLYQESQTLEKDKLDSYPPWKLPRFPSQELVGSKINKICDCKKRNGLQDSCARALCQGSIQCLKKPYPLCVPSGAWKKDVKPNKAQNIMKWLDSLDNTDNKIFACSDSADLCTCIPDFKSKDDLSCGITKTKDKHSEKGRSNDGDGSSVSISKEKLQLKWSSTKKESCTKIGASKSSLGLEETKTETKSSTNVTSANSFNTMSDRTPIKFGSEKSYPLGDINKSIRSKTTSPNCLSSQKNLHKNETTCKA